MQKKLFIPLTSLPESNDKWYTTKKAGGISPCIPGKPQAWMGSTLANCVGFCWGRFAYLEDNPECKVGCAVGNDFPGDAWSWYRNSIAQGYEVGQTPRLGAVAVWSRKGGKGHVASVEKRYDNNEWDSGESGLNTRPYFFSRHYNAKSYRAGYTFIGFIYPKFEFVDKLPPEPTPQKFKIGEEVIINGPLYRTANASKASGSVKNKKTKIALYAEGTMHPYNTTGYLGWMNTSDIISAENDDKLKVGDYVEIIGKGNGRPDGRGYISGGIGWLRYILKIVEGAEYPYQVGLKSGAITGYYKASALTRYM